MTWRATAGSLCLLAAALGTQWRFPLPAIVGLMIIGGVCWITLPKLKNGQRLAMVGIIILLAAWRIHLPLPGGWLDFNRLLATVGVWAVIASILVYFATRLG